jgi:hypothetical protein
VEFVFCLACDLSLPFLGFGHELSFFVFFLLYSFLSLNFISRCVLSMHSSRGRLWRPRFLITVINANDRISRSNGQP